MQREHANFETLQYTLENLQSFLFTFKKETEERFILAEKQTQLLSDRIEILDKKFSERFDNVNERIDVVDKRIDNLEYKIDNLEDKVDDTYKMVKEIHDKKDKLNMEFNRRVLLGNSFLSAIVSFVVAMFTGKYKNY